MDILDNSLAADRATFHEKCVHTAQAARDQSERRPL
jgi:hypothetical protein